MPVPPFLPHMLLTHRNNFQISLATKDIDADRLSIALASKIDRGSPHPEVADANVLQFIRKRRVMQINSRLARANLQPKARLQEHEYRAGGPRLR